MHKINGVGLSYRQVFAEQLEELNKVVDFLEISPEYFYDSYNNEELENLKKYFPLIPHSLSLSIGTFEDLDISKCNKLRDLSNKVNAPFITDHLAVSKVQDYSLIDFIPVFYNEESIYLLKNKINKLHTFFNRNLYLENITYQYTWPNNTLNELEFWIKLLKESEIGMLLDVSNLYVNAMNHKYDPYEFFNALPKDKIHHLHIAGYIENNGILIDSHSESISKEVWELYEHILNYAPIQTVNLERDINVKGVEDVYSDLLQLRLLFNRYRSESLKV